MLTICDLPSQANPDKDKFHLLGQNCDNCFAEKVKIRDLRHNMFVFGTAILDAGASSFMVSGITSSSVVITSYMCGGADYGILCASADSTSTITIASTNSTDSNTVYWMATL